MIRTASSQHSSIGWRGQRAGYRRSPARSTTRHGAHVLDSERLAATSVRRDGRDAVVDAPRYARVRLSANPRGRGMPRRHEEFDRLGCIDPIFMPKIASIARRSA